MPLNPAQRHVLRLIDDFYDLLYVGGELTVAGIKKLYSITDKEISYHSVVGTLRRAVKDKTISYRVREGRRYYKLTNKTKNRLESLDQFFMKKSNQQWKIIVFDIPETVSDKRNSLRYHLKQLGFLSLQKSVWITNTTIKQKDLSFLDALDIRQYVLVFSTQSLAGWLGKKQIIDTFGLDSFNQKFKFLLEELVDLVKNWRKTKFDNKERKAVAAQFIYRYSLKRYHKILHNMPQLSRQFLPKPWYEDRLKVLIDGLRKI